MKSKFKLLRLKDVVRKIGVSRFTLWRYIKSGKFPKPKKVGKRAPLWNESDVDKWMEKRFEIYLPYATITLYESKQIDKKD